MSWRAEPGAWPAIAPARRGQSASARDVVRERQLAGRGCRRACAPAGARCLALMRRSPERRAAWLARACRAGRLPASWSEAPSSPPRTNTSSSSIRPPSPISSRLLPARSARRRLPASGLGRGRAPFRAQRAGRAARPALDLDRRSSGSCARPARSVARSCAGPCRQRSAAARRRVRGALFPGALRARAGRRVSRRAATALVGVVSSEGTDLERSPAYQAYSARYQEGQRFLEGQRQP